MSQQESFVYKKEHWSGDSRDGVLVNGEGFHFFRMNPSGMILEAYEFYETEDGQEVVTALPEMMNVDWIKDLGFDDFEALDPIEKREFEDVKICLPK